MRELELLEATPFDTGVVLLRYKVKYILGTARQLDHGEYQIGNDLSAVAQDTGTGR